MKKEDIHEGYAWIEYKELGLDGESIIIKTELAKIEIVCKEIWIYTYFCEWETVLKPEDIIKISYVPEHPW